MKKSVATLLISGASIFLPIFLRAQQNASYNENLIDAHNRLFFTRLNQSQLQEPILVRNLTTARSILKARPQQTTKDERLLEQKARSESYYLDALLQFRNEKFEDALSSIHQASTWDGHVKETFSEARIADQIFMQPETSQNLQNAIYILKRNILKRIFEKFYHEFSHNISSLNIAKLSSLRDQFYKDQIVYGERTTTFAVEEIYNYLMLSYWMNKPLSISEGMIKKNCVFGSRYFKALDESAYKKRVFPEIRKSKNRLGDLRQIQIEDEAAPRPYYITKGPTFTDINKLLAQTRKRCGFEPRDGDKIHDPNNVVEEIVPVSVKKKQVLKEVPLTTSWTKAAVSDSPRTTLADWSNYLNSRLIKRGYDNCVYYELGDGFALLTPFERFLEDGTPSKLATRFSVTINSGMESSFDYFNKLFLADKGYYRFMIITASSTAVPMGNNKRFTYQIAGDMISGGMDRLSPEILQRPANKYFLVNAYVYEFELTEYATPPKFLTHHKLSGKRHIDGSKIFLP